MGENMFAAVASPLFEVYFVILIFFSILTINKKQIWSPEAAARIFNYSSRWLYKYYSFKQNKPRACCNFIKYFFYLQETAADIPKKCLFS